MATRRLTTHSCQCVGADWDEFDCIASSVPVFLLLERTSNKQNTTEALPKDGVQRFKRIDKGGSTFLIYYFKDDIVYKQIGIYFYNPKGLGKSEEEVVQLLNKSQELYKDVTGITSKVEKEDGEYIQTVIYDYQTMDWKELHRRDPNQFPATKPKPVKISEAAAKLQEKGYVEYTE